MHARAVVACIAAIALAGTPFGTVFGAAPVFSDTVFGAAPAASGTLTFHVTVSGKSHESGGFSRAESQSELAGFVGCAVIKQKPHSPLGAYVYEVRTSGIYFAGIKPDGPGVYLSVDNFRTGASTSTYGKSDASGTFSINGRSYGSGPTNQSQATVKIWDGGRSGTWTAPHAFRNYPAKVLSSVYGFSFRATWHCTTVLHLTAA